MLALLETAAQTVGSATESDGHGSFPITVLVFFSVLFIYVIAGSAFEHFELHYLHESGLAIMLGGIVGFSYYVYNQMNGSQTVKPISFNEQFFFYFLLPPIIFASGYNLKTKKFFAFMPYTLLFGIVGTFINFSTTVGLTYLASYAKGIWIIEPGRMAQRDISFKDILLFSSTICSSDTVAAVTLIKFKDYPKLYSIVFGEGLANDAVSIILYQAVAEIVEDVNKFSWVTPFSIIGHFVSLASLSILLGVVLGLFSAVFMRRARFLIDNPSAQFLAVFGFGYLSYIVSEICHLSGIITLLITGVVMSHYTFYNLSQSAQISTGSTFNGISLLAEGFIFMYLGLSAFFYTSDDWSITLILIEIVITFVARFMGIFVLSWLAKCLSKWKLSNRELAVIWFAGLVRGAIALGLILKAPVDPLLRSTVLALVLITTVVLGALMPTFIHKMTHHDDSPEPRSRGETQHDTLKMLEEHVYKFKNRDYGNRLHFYWRVFDDTFLKPWLIRDFDPETQKLNKKLKYEEFGPGRLNLKHQLVQSQIKKPPQNPQQPGIDLGEPLLNKNTSNEEVRGESNEHRATGERGSGYDPLNESSIIVSHATSSNLTKDKLANRGSFSFRNSPNFYNENANQGMDLGTGVSTIVEEEKHE